VVPLRQEGQLRSEKRVVWIVKIVLLVFVLIQPS
jgi:hypothetical protein